MTQPTPVSSDRCIVIIDDEPEFLELLRQGLEASFQVRTALRAADGLKLCQELQPDLILLDLHLQDQHGLTVCRTLRESRETAQIPIMILTGDAKTESVIESFSIGADDFVEKPIKLPELKARILARLRMAPTPRVSTSTLGNLELRPHRQEAVVRGQVVPLTPIEMKLLDFFVSHAEKVVRRPEILAEVWKDASVTERVVDTQIAILRRKLSKFDHRFVAIYKTGYMLTRQRRKPRVKAKSPAPTP